MTAISKSLSRDKCIWLNTGAPFAIEVVQRLPSIIIDLKRFKYLMIDQLGNYMYEKHVIAPEWNKLQLRFINLIFN